MSDLEDVPEWVADHGPSISIGRFKWLFHGFGTRLEGETVDVVNVIDIDVEEAVASLPLDSGRHHDERVSDQQFHWAAGLFGARGRKDSP